MLVPRASALLRHHSPAAIAGWISIAVFAAVLSWLAVAQHPVGDYGGESDFYGGYAQGAHGIQGGTWDARRYVIVGPVYEVTLALVGKVTPDLFTAAKLISVVAAVGAAAFWFALLARLLGTLGGLWALGFLIVNGTFLRYGYAASTDMLAVFFQSACLFAALGARGRWAPFLSGLAAALAVLTRYNAIYLVPVLIAAVIWRSASVSKTRRVLATAAGFLVIVAPWVAFSVGQGVIPGEGLIRGYAFYADDHGEWNVQDALSSASTPKTIPGWSSVVGADPRAFVTDRLRQIPIHLRGDARDLIGWPSAVAALFGLVLLWRRRLERRLWPIAIAGAVCFLTLLAAFHSSRYSLPMVMFYASGAAGLSWVTSRGGRGVATGVGLAAIGLTLATSFQIQRTVQRETPREVIAAGQALRSLAPRGAAVIARKGHIAYYSDRLVLPFPRVRSLPELAAYARANGAEYLYFSWLETQMRPELAYMLDPTAAIPGLTIVHSSERKPAILYRIGPDFGRAPDWIANDFQRSLHTARAIVRVQGDQAPVTNRAVLAIDAVLRQDWEEALHYTSSVIATDPNHALAWAVRGETLRRLHRLDEARSAFHRAIELDPSDPAAKIGLGRIELALGNSQRAMHLWRAAAENAEDVRALDEIARLLGGIADSSGVQEIRKDRQRIEREASTDKLRPSAGPPSRPRTGALASHSRRTGSL